MMALAGRNTNTKDVRKAAPMYSITPNSETQSCVRATITKKQINNKKIFCSLFIFGSFYSIMGILSIILPITLMNNCITVMNMETNHQRISRTIFMWLSTASKPFCSHRNSRNIG